VLHLPRAAYEQMLAQAYDELPNEACGLVAGDPTTATVATYHPCRNAAASAKVYTVDPRDHLRADRDAEDRGLELIGVVHSHTHTDPYPSPTDVAAAIDPGWHYLIVSLKHDVPSLRSYRIVDEQIHEEPITLVEPGAASPVASAEEAPAGEGR
jgi:proteasome lid subunit RPN8/RPN11